METSIDRAINRHLSKEEPKGLMEGPIRKTLTRAGLVKGDPTFFEHVKDEFSPERLAEMNQLAGKVLHGAIKYSGLEAAGRLWDLPANLGYGVYEGIKKGEPLREPWRAFKKTIYGEPYYDLEDAGLPIPEHPVAKSAAEVAWALAKNPLNVLIPWRAGISRGLVKPIRVPKELEGKTAKEVLQGIVDKEKPVEPPWTPFKAAEESAQVFKRDMDLTASPMGRRDLTAKLRAEQVEKGIEYTPAELRGIKAAEPGIAQRLAARLRSERGSVPVELTAEESAAIEALKKQARAAGQKVEDVLGEMGFKPQDIALLQQRMAESEVPRPTKISSSKATKARVAKPPIVKKGVDQEKSIADVVEDMDAPPDIVEGPGGKIIHGVSEALDSPEVVFRRGGVVGNQLYRNLDLGDQALNKFMYKEATVYEKARKGIDVGSEGSFRVGRALDAKLDVKTLTPKERKLYNFFVSKYDFLIHKYIKQLTGNRYDDIVSAAGKKIPPMVKLAELSQKDIISYNTYKQMANVLKGTRKVDDLPPLTKKIYNKYREGMRKLLHEEWRKRLNPNEREAYLLLKRKIKNYFPHMWDRGDLLRRFRSDLAEAKTKLSVETDAGKSVRLKTTVKNLEDHVQTLEGGGMVLYEQLPKEYTFKSFEPRRANLLGYSFDSVMAYDRYLHGIGMRMYIHPMVRKNAELHKQLIPSLRGYNKRFTRRYLGMDRHKLDDVVNVIASLEWVRALGFNPRSALVNLTQRINTIAEVSSMGKFYATRGYIHALSKEGRALFDSTGVAQEIPTVMVEGWGPARGFGPVKTTKMGKVLDKTEKIRRVAGFLFNRMELGNRKHAFSAGYIRAKAKGMTEEAAKQAGIDLVHKTQFRYGKIGMPMAFTHPAGRLPLQFWSYPVKQAEFLFNMGKTNPLKLVKYFALAEGGGWALREFCDIDLSNALGLGMNWGRAIQAIRDVSKADWEGFITNTKLFTSGGGGMLPTGLGPAVTGIKDIYDASKERRGLSEFVRQVTPVQVWRMYQGYESLVNKQGELYPVLDRAGDPMYFLTKYKVLQRTFGPRTKKDYEEGLDWTTEVEREKERRANLDKIVDALADGKSGLASKLIMKYGVVPTPEQVMNKVFGRHLSRKQRELLRRGLDKKAIYFMQREDEFPFEE